MREAGGPKIYSPGTARARIPRDDGPARLGDLGGEEQRGAVCLARLAIERDRTASAGVAGRGDRRKARPESGRRMRGSKLRPNETRACARSARTNQARDGTRSEFLDGVAISWRTGNDARRNAVGDRIVHPRDRGEPDSDGVAETRTMLPASRSPGESRAGPSGPRRASANNKVRSISSVAASLWDA